MTILEVHFHFTFTAVRYSNTNFKTIDLKYLKILFFKYSTILLFEALFEADLGILETRDTQKVELQSQIMPF